MVSIRTKTLKVKILICVISITSKCFALGIVDGCLEICPSKPNCVNSCFEDDHDHYISPWNFSSTDAISVENQIINLFKNDPNATIVTQRPTYVHVEITSRFFKFIDDVEFLIDHKNSLIHVKSASRTGYYDFSVNRKRVKKLEEIFLNP